jgi:hypothetical protein
MKASEAATIINNIKRTKDINRNQALDMAVKALKHMASRAGRLDMLATKLVLDAEPED